MIKSIISEIAGFLAAFMLFAGVVSSNNVLGVILAVVIAALGIVLPELIHKNKKEKYWDMLNGKK